MEKLKYCMAALCIALLVQPVWGQGERSKVGVHQGLVRVQATFALGFLNASAETRSYIYGEAEGMLDDHIGLDGGIYFQAGSSVWEVNSGLTGQNGDFRTHSLFAGPNYHFLPHKPIDVFVGIQPGLHLSFAPLPDFATGNRRANLSPAASLNAGLAWYGSFFHLFGQVRGVWGNHLGDYGRYSISEIRACFGLGFNFN